MDRQRFDIELLDDEDPFEIDSQRPHLAKHPMMDPDDVREVWASDPLFYEARPDGEADWLMVCTGPGGRDGGSARSGLDVEDSPAGRHLRGPPGPCTPVPAGPMMNHG